MKVLHKRYLERDTTPERDRANRSDGILDDYEIFEKSIKPLGEFNVGDRILKIDTTNINDLNYATYINEAKLFLDKTC